MRNLYELFSETESECIWFWIGPSIDTKQNFMKNCEKSGISVSNFYLGNAVSLHRDGELRHVSIMVWTAGFSADGFKTVPKIDYEKLSVVGQDYIITKCIRLLKPKLRKHISILNTPVAGAAGRFYAI